ncbi:NADH-quinone oxidoreductase subunit J [Allostreptomyces psammosilenae]|uniref:NADH-quinone oxidoreductase subunit J n=1 Tax=Allostreptomyces psammosilenae TaxID=1892865 RepID=UPI0015C767F4
MPDATTLLAATTSSAEAVQFWVLGTVAVLGALGTVLMRKAVHSALCLAAVMIVLAVFYIAQGAVFLGVVQVVVYTGAIMMLFLFVLMLVGVDSSQSLTETLRGQRWAAAVAALGFALVLAGAVSRAGLDTFTGLAGANAYGNVQGIAVLLFTRYVWAFELTGILLITAAVGAMVLTHRERTEPRRGQAALAAERIRRGEQITPLPAPGVYARHNAVDIPALLPDGTPLVTSVNPVLRARGQMREASEWRLPATRLAGGLAEVPRVDPVLPAVEPVGADDPWAGRTALTGPAGGEHSPLAPNGSNGSNGANGTNGVNGSNGSRATEGADR